MSVAASHPGSDEGDQRPLGEHGGGTAPPGTTSASSAAPAGRSAGTVARPTEACEPRSRFNRGDCEQSPDQIVHAYRLGDVALHARGDALLAIAVHRIRGHRHDARPARDLDTLDDLARRLE